MMDVELSWKKVKDTYLEVSEKVLGFHNHLKKEWMSDDTWKKIEARKLVKAKINMCKTRQQKAAAQKEYVEADKNVKKSVRKDHISYKHKWQKTHQKGEMLRDCIGSHRNCQGEDLSGINPLKTRKANY